MSAVMEFLKNNIGTIAVAAVLIAVLAAIALKIIRDRKNGRSACSCGCSGCPMSEKCHEKAEKK